MLCLREAEGFFLREGLGSVEVEGAEFLCYSNRRNFSR
jgi:hypothetical protein